MLALALRYLALAVVVAVGFALLQGSQGWAPEPSSRRAMTRPGPEAGAPYAVRAGPHGHFVLEATVDLEPVRFLVDTGASEVILSPEDAERLGFRRHELRFVRHFQSANGTVRAAPVVLREVRIGEVSFYDVEAAVNEAPLEVSLLGMSLLRRLAGYRIERNRLYLYF